jgi:hypothetical protein
VKKLYNFQHNSRLIAIIYLWCHEMRWDDCGSGKLRKIESKDKTRISSGSFLYREKWKNVENLMNYFPFTISFEKKMNKITFLNQIKWKSEMKWKYIQYLIRYFHLLFCALHKLLNVQNGVVKKPKMCI